MQKAGWEYYNHAAIPTTAPHEAVNLQAVEDGSIWQMDGGKPILARWSYDWDCGQETEWWYVIKDEPFDISALKSKRRYEINKGNKNFSFRKIAPDEYTDELFRVTVEAYKGWPEKYRPNITEAGFRETIKEWKKYDVFAAFGAEDGRMCGYALLEDMGASVNFTVLRTIPETEKLAINAAMVNGILEHYKDRFDGKFYINDGARAIRHETAFQDYLEKYFNFRKAYCRLNIRYKKGFGAAIKMLYPFRKLIPGKTGIGSMLAGLLKMEEIRRKCGS